MDFKSLNKTLTNFRMKTESILPSHALEASEKNPFLASPAQLSITFARYCVYKGIMWDILMHLPDQSVVLLRKTVDNQHWVDWLL